MFVRCFDNCVLLECVLTNWRYLNLLISSHRDVHVEEWNVIDVDFLSSHEYFEYFEILIHSQDNFHNHHRSVDWQEH